MESIKRVGKEPVQEQRERAATAKALRNKVLHGIKIFRDKVRKAMKDQEETSSQEDTCIHVNFSLEEFDCDFNQYVDACNGLPKSTRQLPHEDLVCALKIVRLAAVYRSLKRVVQEKGEEDNCAICIEGLTGGCGDAWALECGHSYHEICIVKWLHRESFCPLCRREVCPLKGSI